VSRPVPCVICHAELAPQDRGRVVTRGDVCVGYACHDIPACSARVDGRLAQTAAAGAIALTTAAHLARILRNQSARLRAVADEQDQAAALLEGTTEPGR
jgi:hypothetical protein